MLGGVSFMGGSGALTGAFFGILLTQVLANTMTTMGLPAWVVQFTNGMLLVIALTIDTMSTRLRLRRLGLKASGGGGGIMMPGMSR
jgi:ribose/xylose/arabinose/galactoside ABC-type transport system permease subunit